MHTLLDVLHVVAAVFLIGPLAILPMSGMRALRAGQGPAVASLARSTAIFAWASLAVVVFGFGVLGTTDKRYGLSITTPWIWISIVLYLIALGLTLFAVVPAMKSAAAIGDTENSTAGGYGRIAMASGIASLLLLVVVILMVAKP
jgi:uncharacterized membrane protein